MKFDPFENRACRDVRNHMGHDMATAIISQQPQMFKNSVKNILDQDISKEIEAYVLHLDACFDKALNTLQALSTEEQNFKNQFVILWNLGLFFECHELAEEKWGNAPLRDKKGYQGLVLAAVAYEQKKYHRDVPALSVGEKAAKLLTANPVPGWPAEIISRLSTALEKMASPPALSTTEF